MEPSRRAAFVVVAVASIGLSACGDPNLYAGCEAACRRLYECTFNAPQNVDACSQQCVIDNQNKSAACKDAVSALGTCGAGATCEQLATTCSDEFHGTTTACSGIGGDAGVDTGVDGASGGYLTLALDRTTIASHIAATETVQATVTAHGGLSGDVVVVGTMRAPTDWTVGGATQFATLAADGSATVALGVSIPSDTAYLSGTLDVVTRTTAIDSVPDATATSNVTAIRELTIVFPAGTGSGRPHNVGYATLAVRTGTILHFSNQDSIPHALHGDGTGGILHEMNGGGQPGAVYSVTITGNDTWECHDHELAQDAHIVTLTP
jgi:hypothetical protein